MVGNLFLLRCTILWLVKEEKIIIQSMFDDDRFFTICHSLLNIPFTKYLARLGLGLQASACRLFLDNVQGSVSKFQNGDVNIHSSCFYL